MIQYPDFKDVISLNNATATGPGKSLLNTDVTTNVPTAVSFSGTYATPRSPGTVYTVLAPAGPVATVAVEAMTPSGTWMQIQSFTLSATTPAYFTFMGVFPDIRANCTAYTSGNVYVWIGKI